MYRHIALYGHFNQRIQEKQFKNQAELHYTVVARCDGIHGFLYTRGEGCHLPPRVYKTHGPQSQRATIVLLYLGNIVIPLLEVLLSSSNIIMME